MTYYEEYKGLDVNLSIITIDKTDFAAKEADRLYNSVEEELAELRATESETEQKSHRFIMKVNKPIPK